MIPDDRVTRFPSYAHGPVSMSAAIALAGLAALSIPQGSSGTPKPPEPLSLPRQTFDVPVRRRAGKRVDPQAELRRLKDRRTW